MIYITAIHMEPTNGTSHEHIARVRWTNPSTNASDDSTRQGMVDWINKGGDARVKDGLGSVHVGVVDAKPPYLRTYADDRYTDNLLALPRY